MDRKDVLSSPEYWVTLIQTNLYDCAMRYMKSANINRKQLAEQLGVSKGYVSQLLNGDFDHRLSKFVELSLAFGYIPKVEFIKTSEYLQAKSIIGKMVVCVCEKTEYQPYNEVRIENNETSKRDWEVA